MARGGSGKAPLTTKGIWMHAWDLRDHGPDHVMGWIQDSGLNQMCIASCPSPAATTPAALSIQSPQLMDGHPQLGAGIMPWIG